MKVESIVVVGGGSSGWMTAALIAKKLPHIKLTVIEPENIPTIGVGESTLGHINRYLAQLDILLREKEWMPYCAATYKVSIQFTDFGKIGERFQYPFGSFDVSNGKSLQDYAYIKAMNPDWDVSFANFYNPISYLADHNKMTPDSRVIRNYGFLWDTAYHFDAARFGEWLKLNICEPAGTNIIRDSIVDIVTNEDGIEYLKLEKDPSSKITADLFIDCTGFKSLLLEKTMKSKFISYSDVLPNDKAIATRLPYVDKTKEIHNVTDCHALSAGWVWDIPLWHRKGTGYVYSSKYISRDEAADEFRQHLAKQDADRARDAEFFDIDIRHGKREKAWVKNVVGIGLSYGFLEPLESTGLFTTHENALMLVNSLERRDGFISKIDIDGYNYAVDHIIECFKSFIQMHYSLSTREDSKYWRDQIHNTPLFYNDDHSDKTMTSPRLYKEFVHAHNVTNVAEDLQGSNYIAAGMGYSHIGKTETEFRLIGNRYADRSRINKFMNEHSDYEKLIMRHIPNMQSTYEFLQHNVYFEYLETERKSFDF